MEFETPEGDNNEVVIQNVLVVPGLSENLLSVDALAEKGVNCKFTRSEMLLLDDQNQGNIFGYGRAREDGLRYLVCETKLKRKAALGATAAVLDLWHERLGHIAKAKIREMVNDGTVEGIHLC